MPSHSEAKDAAVTVATTDVAPGHYARSFRIAGAGLLDWAATTKARERAAEPDAERTVQWRAGRKPVSARQSPVPVHEPSSAAHKASRDLHEAWATVHDVSSSAPDATCSAHSTSSTVHEALNGAHEAPRRLHEAPRRLHEAPRKCTKHSGSLRNASGSLGPAQKTHRALIFAQLATWAPDLSASAGNSALGLPKGVVL